MEDSLKNKIITLREEGKSYNEISETLGCSKGNISYHCKNHGLNYIGLRRRKLTGTEIKEVREYYKNHTIIETSENFSISKSTVKRYVSKKRVLLTEPERRKRNYQRVKSRRQSIKEMAVAYKGGRCEKCGYNKCIWALDFHHINKEEKDFNVAQYLTLSWEKIKKELDKCIIICTNCHRELHYEEYINKKYV